MSAKTKRRNSRYLLKELVRSRIKVRYNNSFLGYIWVLAQPILQFTIILFVWKAIGRGAHDPYFTPNLLIALLTFSLFREGFRSGSNALLDLKQVLLKINIPSDYAIKSSIYMSLFNFFINVLVIGVIITIVSRPPELIGVAYYLLIILTLTIGTYGLSLFFSIWHIKLRDLGPVIDLGLMVLFWGSAIFYRVEDVSGPFRFVVELNPLATLIEASRKGLVFGEIQHMEKVLLFLGISIVLVILGRIYFRKESKRVAEKI